MTTVKIIDAESIKNDQYKYAVIVTRYQDDWIFVRHKDRQTWEFPGGRREANENIYKTAERELIEETGASHYKIQPISAYAVTIGTETSYGLLCYAEVTIFGRDLLMEIEEIKTFSKLPLQMTYPDIIPVLMDYVKGFLDNLN